MKELALDTKQLKDNIDILRAGDRVLLSGVVYTARDAAHKRLTEMINAGQPLPFEINGACIYFAGPTPAPEGMVIGSCGPTTSGRMDAYSPLLLDHGLCGMIGKGPRSRDVIDSIVKNRAVYFCAVGGAGALATKCITEAQEIAFGDLGCESIKRLVLKDFPLVVGIDCKGNSIIK